MNPCQQGRPCGRSRSDGKEFAATVSTASAAAASTGSAASAAMPRTVSFGAINGNIPIRHEAL